MVARCPVAEEGHGGSGVLPHAVNSNAASVMEVFQYVGRAENTAGSITRDLDGE